MRISIKQNLSMPPSPSSSRLHRIIPANIFLRNLCWHKLEHVTHLLDDDILCKLESMNKIMQICQFRIPLAELGALLNSVNLIMPTNRRTRKKQKETERGFVRGKFQYHREGDGKLSAKR